jgi:hypothetical protein
MRRVFLVLSIVFATASAPGRAVGQNVEGVWRLSYVVNNVEASIGYFKIEDAGGKTRAEPGAGTPGITVKSVSVANGILRLNVRRDTGIEWTFEADLTKGDARRRPGAIIADSTISPAWLTAVDEEKLSAKPPLQKPLQCPPLKEAITLLTKANTLKFRVQAAKDPAKKKELEEQFDAADKIAKKETPRLYQEVLAKHADDPAVFLAALNLIRTANANAAKEEDVKSWGTTAMNAAKPYGQCWQGELATQLGAVLLAQDGFEKLAVDYARQAAKALPAKVSATEEVRVLTLLVRALKKTRQDAEAKTLEVRLAKLDEVLDEEYAVKMPGFKGTVFTGRKSKSGRAVFMELFTGASCPPCVAADLAFDVLQKSYKPSELVLVQYQLHIPGPDLLTNPDTEARRDYYAKSVRGVPSSFFNGKAVSGIGGPITFAEEKYDACRAIIDPLLNADEDAGAKITLEAKRDGERIDINVKVSGLAEPDANKKLRILLAEETVHYAGSNKIRLHHNVVRAFPGGVAGQPLKEAASRHKASINLADLRTDLTKYLNNYEQTFRPFTNPARPLALDKLRVIAFVQDDNTQEILQAVQAAVEGK